MDNLSALLGALPIPARTIPKPTSLLVYVASKTTDSMCYFKRSSEQFIVARCDSTKDLEVGRLYRLTTTSAGQYTIAEPSAQDNVTALNRASVSLNARGYIRVVSALLLGCRIRDFEQTCATVLQCMPLIISMPNDPGRFDEVIFRTESGKTFGVRVTRVDRNDGGGKTMKVFCRPQTTLPSGLTKNSRLDYNLDYRIPIVTQSLERFYDEAIARMSEGRDIVNSTLLAIYGIPESIVHPSVDSAIVKILKKTGEDVLLNAEQSQPIHRINSGCKALVIEAPPGSGKTLTASAIAIACRRLGVMLFLSTANVAVFNVATTLDGIDHRLKIGHIVSTEREESQKAHEKTPLSIYRFEEPILARIRRLERELDYANYSEKRVIRERIRDARTEARAARGSCDVILATVDMALCFLMKPKNRENTCPIQLQLENDVRRVVIDEASQLTEAAMNALMSSFPLAQFVFIGDSKQLPPFKYVKGEVVSELSSCSALEVLKRKRNLPVITLHHVYRAAPSLIAHYSSAFYDGALVSRKPESTRGIRRLPLFHQPLLVMPRNFTAERAGTSLTNANELSILKATVEQLRKLGYHHDSMMVIAFYDAQRRDAAKALPGYEVLTVDSAQGREKDIVIVLTTADSRSITGFLTSPLRSNVAVSRHKEALIVFGDKALLTRDPWSRLLSKDHFTHINA